MPSEEVFASLADPDFDIRPRVFCNATQSWYLVDSGSQVSVLKPSAGDKVNPNILLEAVNGTNMKCYGKKQHSVRFSRKTYHIEAVISETNENILGMDFIAKYRFDFRWGPFGDLYLYDPKSQTSTLCEFVKIPKDSLPRIASVSVLSTPRVSTCSQDPPPSHPHLAASPHSSSKDFLFQVFSIAKTNVY